MVIIILHLQTGRDHLSKVVTTALILFQLDAGVLGSVPIPLVRLEVLIWASFLLFRGSGTSS